jgi:tRNA G18 (ribose-2'-O)-methylase SpoU
MIIACSPMKSNVNISTIARVSSCFGLELLILTGNNKLVKDIARDYNIPVEFHRSLLHPLKDLKKLGYSIISLEQAKNSKEIYTFKWPKKSVLVLGNERKGISEDILDISDHIVEIPVDGMPHSHNVAIAASMAIYEYNRNI